MRLVIVPLALLAGCIQGPISYHSLTPATSDVAYNCALRRVNELGYTVTKTSKESGFIVGDKQTSTWTEAITGRRHFDRLTVSIFATDSAWRTVRVTAASVQVRTRVSVGDESDVPTRATAKADATAVVTACTDGVLIGNR
jgi:hypothetical protein